MAADFRDRPDDFLADFLRQLPRIGRPALKWAKYAAVSYTHLTLPTTERV